MNKHKKFTIFLAVIVLSLALLSTGAFAQALAGGTLDPTTVPKYITPLVIPPVMNNNGVADNYDIAVRQFMQQILPAGYPATELWSYGPAADPVPAVAAPDPLSQFNYPAYTIETTSNLGVNVRWINDLVTIDPATGFPYPVGDLNRAPLPHLLSVDQTLHWANPGPTPCNDPAKTKDCTTDDPTPYTGPVPMVTHLHGAHVMGHSDGYPEAWWLPADVDPLLYETSGTLFGDSTGTNPGNLGYADYSYLNTQPATTLWYHDHALGMTRLNVYAGPAGFWLIRGAFDSAIDGLSGLPSVLPGPAPVAGQGVLALNVPGDPVRNSIREIPIVIQDRSFNVDGSLFYPDNRAFFEGLNVEGTDAAGGQFPPGSGELQIPFVPGSDIAPIWNPEAFFNTMVVNGVTWPKLDVAPAKYRFRLLNGCNSRFLNLAMFTVDPVTNATTAVELPFYQIGGDQGFLPNVVEIRTGFMTAINPAIVQKLAAELAAKIAQINTLIASFQAKAAVTTNPKIIAKLNAQIATLQARIPQEEQKIAKKLINQTIGIPTPGPDPMQALLMGNAERADVIVDFSGLADGTIVRMVNTGSDGPFGGFLGLIPADPGTTGQVMEFVVNAALLGQSPTDATATNHLAYLLNAEPANAAPIAATKTLSLNEEESATLCVTVDVLGNTVPVPGVLPPLCGGLGVGMAPKAALLGTFDPLTGISTPLMWSDPMTERPLQGDTELWEVYNLTVDGHPIHLHLVRYQVVDRQLLDLATNLPIGLPFLPEVNETGYKDTVIAYPGEVTRLKATFDLAGLYVWHCHIVEHEDNEMMRPFCVDAAVGTDSCPAVP